MGDAVRKIMHKEGSAGLWSNCNLKGRNEKLPFEASPVYKLFRRKYIFRVTTSREIRYLSWGWPYIVAVLDAVFY